MLYVGIDPGEKGGVTTIDQAGEIHDYIIMPSHTDFHSYMKEKRYSIKRAYIEHAQSFPYQGRVSIFNYGEHFGMIQGIIFSLGIPFSLVRPRTWQKAIIVPSRHKDTKKKALFSANKIFKKQSRFWIPTKRHTKPHDGVIDSALIAKYCQINSHLHE